MTEREPFSLAARIDSFRCALRGARHVLVSQPNARIHAVATIAACGLGLWLGLGALEWCAIVLAIVLVWTAESLNTALEFLCDVASPEYHPLVEKAKDVAAAVAFAALGAVAIGLLVLGPPLLRLFA